MSATMAHADKYSQDRSISLENVIQELKSALLDEVMAAVDQQFQAVVQKVADVSHQLEREESDNDDEDDGQEDQDVDAFIFMLTLRVADTAELGVVAVPVVGSASTAPKPSSAGLLRVEAIRPRSAAEAWNRQCFTNGSKDKVLKRGDLISRVNDHAGDAEVMLRECRTRQLLRLQILRLPRERSRSLTEVSNQFEYRTTAVPAKTSAPKKAAAAAAATRAPPPGFTAADLATLAYKPQLHHPRRAAVGSAVRLMGGPRPFSNVMTTNVARGAATTTTTKAAAAAKATLAVGAKAVAVAAVTKTMAPFHATRATPLTVVTNMNAIGSSNNSNRSSKSSSSTFPRAALSEGSTSAPHSFATSPVGSGRSSPDALSAALECLALEKAPGLEIVDPVAPEDVAPGLKKIQKLDIVNSIGDPAKTPPPGLKMANSVGEANRTLCAAAAALAAMTATSPQIMGEAPKTTKPKPPAMDSSAEDGSSAQDSTQKRAGGNRRGRRGARAGRAVRGRDRAAAAAAAAAADAVVVPTTA